MRARDAGRGPRTPRIRYAVARMAVVIESGTARVVIEPAQGAGIADFALRGPANFYYPLMRRAPHGDPSPSNLACFSMAPWCNRIPGGVFAFRGVRHALRATAADGTAIHGDVRARPWRILDRTPVSARLAFESAEHPSVNYPFPFACEVRYELEGSRLTVDLSVINRGDGPMPAGCGLHPYFPRRLWDERDRLEIEAPCAGRYPARETIPSGPMRDDALCRRLRTLAPLEDSVRGSEIFGGFAGRARLAWPASGVELTIEASPNLGHLVLFCPHHRDGAPSPLPHVALEPQSHVTDAINLADSGASGTGLAVLERAGRLDTRTVFEARTR